MQRTELKESSFQNIQSQFGIEVSSNLFNIGEIVIIVKFIRQLVRINKKQGQVGIGGCAIANSNT